jgi:hypothetical protein
MGLGQKQENAMPIPPSRIVEPSNGHQELPLK